MMFDFGILAVYPPYEDKGSWWTIVLRQSSIGWPYNAVSGWIDPDFAKQVWARMEKP